MVKTSSLMIPLGSHAPLFSLKNVLNDKIFSLTQDSNIPITVIMFICNHCPFVRHINKELTKNCSRLHPKYVRFIAINSNDIDSYPEDSPENMKKVALNEHYPFPYLFDQTQEVAKAYKAVCTPDFFVYNNQLELVYRGQFDDSRPGNQIPSDGSSLRQALDDLLANRTISIHQKSAWDVTSNGKNK